ncbi:MAG: hypothetical protein JNM08_08285 [Rubrivivax sp.]|nr:hypothetical protein [Rubrivivax sp.]
MKISHRLMALSALSAGALALVAGVSWFAVTSIQQDLRSLTQHATPLQTKTFELQERMERFMGGLLRLSLARSADDATKAGTALGADGQAIARLRQEIRTLDPKAAEGGLDTAAAQRDIAAAVERRLADEAAYQRESAQATSALAQAEQAVAVTRRAAQQIGVEAGQAADKAQEASRRLAATIRGALSAQARLREIVLVVSEADLATNRFRLSPLKDKFKSPIDSIQRLEAEPGGDDPLKETRQVAAGLYEAATRDGTGLLALRAAVLANKNAETEAAYARQRKALLDPVEQQIARLNAVLDTTEAAAAKQRQVLEAAIKLRNEPGGVVGTSEEVSLRIREMVGLLRLLMLSTGDEELQASAKDLEQQGQRLAADMQTMKAGLQKLGRPQLAQQVDEALALMAGVRGSVGQVATSKRQLLASQGQMAESLAKLKATAAQQASLGEQQARAMGQRQGEVVAAVDGRVGTSLAVILGIAGVAIAITVLLSLHLVRQVTRQLDAAVAVAERVSRGELVNVPEASGSDETARLMAAMGSMVRTLEGIVGNIRQAADQIHSGSTDIGSGNRDLSSRTEQQSAQLQQTASSVEELSATVQRNAEAASSASQLAAQASGVASQGGQLVTSVVDTMSEIEASSKKIAEIVAVIDGIAFQTNILALNAAVEAARAGEQGRGFAVVASEVRSLAGRSAEAAGQVKAIVQHSVQAVAGGAALVRDAGDTMQDIVRQVHQVSTLINEIASASQGQAASVAHVSEAVQTLDSLTQQNAALAEQTSAAATSLGRQAEGLTEAIRVFKLGAAAG